MVWTASGGKLTVARNGNTSETSRGLSSMAAVENFATAAQGGTPTSFPAAPTLSRLVQCWIGTARWRPRRRWYKQVAAAQREKQGKRELGRRLEVIERQDPERTAAMAALK